MKIGFDKVYCISYCRNIEKQNNVRKLMKYLGIDFEFIYGADFSNLEILKHTNFNFYLGWSNCKWGPNPENEEESFKYFSHFVAASYDHYTAIIHAYESNANSILIFEDDCQFINDIDKIYYCLNNYPKDSDIVRFGAYFMYYDFKENLNIFINPRKENVIYDGSQMYGICNRETMKIRR